MSNFVPWLGPRDALTLWGPEVRVALDISATWLRENAADPVAVGNAVQRILAGVMNATVPASGVRVAVLTEVAAAEPGVAAVRSLTLNGDDEDWPADPGLARFSYVPSAISLDPDVRIVPD